MRIRVGKTGRSRAMEGVRARMASGYLVIEAAPVGDKPVRVELTPGEVSKLRALLATPATATRPAPAVVLDDAGFCDLCNVDMLDSPDDEAVFCPCCATASGGTVRCAHVKQAERRA